MGQHAIGERFGDYTLVRPLGEGGFASVYLGEEVHKGTSAAVKLPKEQQVHDFINELRRTVLLQHPNIIKILDFGIRRPDDTAFIIMEYAPNGSFREKYPRGTRVPLDVVVPTVKQVASALQYAHDQRVIHRDVKPENLLLNAKNMVLLSDFGIATASRTAMTAYASQIGQTIITGTYAYTAPEQLRGRPVPASDQYSLGIMVYEWLCGELPFEGREYMQWLYVHEKEPPPTLRDYVPALSPNVEQVVLKALAKRPEERFERVEMFALALGQAARGEDVSTSMNAPEPAIRSTPFESALSNNPLQTPANSIEQLFQEGVRAQASGNAEEAFRIWRQVTTRPGVAERYTTTARNRIRELRTQMIPLRLKQAREASMQGRWQDEIRLWEDLLALEPVIQDLSPHLKSPLTLGKQTSNLTQRIEERLQVARQNDQCAWMYTGAQQFIKNNDNAAARTQLQMLWNDAPYYGDTAKLAKMVGLPTALNYEQSIAAEQARLEQERQEQKRLEQERQEQARLEQARREQERLEQAQREQARLEQLRQNQAQTALKRGRRMLILVSIMVAALLIPGCGFIGEILGKEIVKGLLGEITGSLLGGIVGGIIWAGMIGGNGRNNSTLTGEIVGEGVITVIIVVGIISGIIGGGMIGGGMIGGILGGIAGGVIGGIIMTVAIALGTILEIMLEVIFKGIIIGIAGVGIIGWLAAWVIGGGTIERIIGAVIGGVIGGILSAALRRMVRNVYK